MGRTLLLVSLCLAFPNAQQRVIHGRLMATLQQATGHADHAPEHDWRRSGGGTTRAIERRTERSALSFGVIATSPVPSAPLAVLAGMRRPLRAQSPPPLTVPLRV